VAASVMRHRSKRSAMDDRFGPVAIDWSLMVRNFANGAICVLLTLVPGAGW